jgi:hypothetical protein
MRKELLDCGRLPHHAAAAASGVALLSSLLPPTPSKVERSSVMIMTLGAAHVKTNR